MNNDKFTKEQATEASDKKSQLLDDVKKNIGKKPSEIKKEAEKEKRKKSTGSVPPPPPPPPLGMGIDANQIKKIISEALGGVKEEMAGMRKQLDKLEGENKQFKDNEKFWTTNASNYLKSLQLSHAENDQLKQDNKELKKKLDILPLRPQPKNIPIMTERDKQIIEQAKAHVETITNSTTLRNRVLEAEKEGTKDAYWNLHTDLTKAGDIQKKLIQYFQGDIDEATQFTWTLGAILRGEYLEKK